jgi:hypothetical protein
VIQLSRDDPFPVYIDRESKSLVSVMKGCYVTPFMPALFTRNRHLIDDILMDATWKIIRVYVASILMLSICHFGIPVMLDLGSREDKALSETFYTILKDHFHINLNGYRVVSDQGTTLCVVCIDHEKQQFLCLRHFLVSVKRKMWSHEAGTLIHCRVRDDFQQVWTEYAPRFAEALQNPSCPVQCHSEKLSPRLVWRWMGVLLSSQIKRSGDRYR